MVPILIEFDSCFIEIHMDATTMPNVRTVIEFDRFSTGSYVEAKKHS